MKEQCSARRLLAEALGTAFLLMAVVGSGIMGERLAGGNTAVALLANTLATGAALVVLISILGPISGAHFNPAVSLVFMLRRELPIALGITYVAVQIVSGIAGVFAAHLMFEKPVFEIATKLRDGPAQAFSEFIATFGLVVTILGALRYCPERI
ncbi:MAG: MIP/aquaporin family protein, partial [Rhizomicrobium sp.]